jgi:hypothetical protein
MSPEQWGPPIWTLFHTLVQRIKEEKYTELGPHLFFYIKRICRYLPCPDCSNHASTFLNKIEGPKLKTKADLVNTIYIMHNVVNIRKKKQLQQTTILEKYKNISVIQAYNSFASIYKTRGNMKLLTDTFQRQLIVNDFKKWLVTNLVHFM